MIATLACSDGSPLQEICAAYFFSSFGFDPDQLDRSLIPVLTSNSPAGVSMKMLKHFGQQINSGHFRRYDYKTSNMDRYNSSIPPNFTLSEASAPIALYYSQNDFFVAVEDVEKLAKELPNVVKKKLIEYKKFNHLDFIFAKDVNTLLNNDLLDHMRGFIEYNVTTSTSQPTTPKDNAGNSIKSSFSLIFVFISLNTYSLYLLGVNV
ncbi:hypothetical protein JTB14_034809 [Gonioctena quinquepunctata]|nr:hypothetical protein JTB14_034809 [Gonioctena quinquepunctata]